MNRSVLARQMFAKGGAAFPDLSGDGNITQKDILIGRGVPMQGGGEPQMALGDYLGDQTDELAAEAARLGISISKEQLLELLNQQAMQPQANARSRNPDMANYIDESGELFYDPASEAASRRQMFDEAAAIAAKYQQPVGMAMGGDPAMAQGVGGMMPPDMAPPPAMPQDQAIDPQVLESALSQAQENLGNIDEAEDYETVINSIRGDDAPISARYQELASVVGEEDAAQTPESVLTLVQPAMVMGAVDQGIGGLAAEEMTQPVQGAMAQGIMSSVAPPPPAAPMPPGGMGGPPPVNFNQGGLVRRGDNQPVQMYENGGEATPLQTAYEGRLPLYKSIVGDPTAQLEEQKNLTQAQMLFDIAGTALAYAAPMQGETAGMSPAERLAMAVTQTKLLPTIGARAQQQLDTKKAATAAEQKMKLGALGAAEADVTAQAKAAADLKKVELEGAQKVAQLTLKDALDTKRDLTVQTDLYGRKSALQIQKFALQDELNGADSERRLEIETELKGIDLENDKVMEGIKADNKKALQETIFDQNKQLAILKADKNFATSTALQASAAKIDENLAVLRSNLRIGELGVSNEFDLEKLSLTQGFDRELNNTNNALKEKLSGLDRELSERRLKLDTIKAAIAEKQGQEKIDLQREAQEMEADLNAFTMNYKTDKLDLERAAARLTRLGTSTEARITTLISDPESLAKYAAGTMGPEDTLEFNQAIAYYNAPKQVWNEKEKKFVLSPGNPLSNELMSSIRIRQENKLTIPNIKLDQATSDAVTPKPKEEVVSSIMAGIGDPSVAFGTEGAAKSVANTVAEIFFFGAPYKAAIAGVKALNTKFVQVFQRSAELRDSVMQLNLLKDLTPDPASVFTGPEAAAEDVTRLLGMITEAEQALNTKLDDPNSPLTSKEVSEARSYLTDLGQLRAGYSIFDNAYKNVSKSKVDALRGALNLGKK